MNEVAIKLKQSLTCSNCSKIFKDPIELPCEDLICKEHLNDKEVLKQNKIKCCKCKLEFKVKDKKFKLNKSIQNQIDDQIYFNDDEKKLKKKIEESIKVFHQMFNEFTSNKHKLNLDCQNHFQEIRRQIDLQRRDLKEKIDEIYIITIEKTKEIEASYLKMFKEKLTLTLKSFETKSLDEELNQLDESFRDPNLLIESIKEVQFKQEESIETIQSILNEMNRMKVDLKASNTFKPNLTFDEDSFGFLYFNGQSLQDLFKSKILKGEQALELINLCEFDQNDTFKLLYRASRDGCGSSDFHSKCDGHANTLTLFKASETSFIFGTFTSASQPGRWRSDPNAFVFSLTNKENKPCKMKICPDEHFERFPILDGDDIGIYSNSNAKTENFSNIDSTFKHSQYAAGTSETQSFWAGSHLSDIEVYLKE